MVEAADDPQNKEFVPKQPAYGGEAEAARLRAHVEEVQQHYVPRDVAEARIREFYNRGATASLTGMECSHPATYVARVCASCSTVMEIEP